MEQKKRIVALLFSAARNEWTAYNAARTSGSIEEMRNAFAAMIKFLSILSLVGEQEEVKRFIADNEMPKRSILKRIKKIEQANDAK